MVIIINCGKLVKSYFKMFMYSLILRIIIVKLKLEWYNYISKFTFLSLLLALFKKKLFCSLHDLMIFIIFCVIIIKVLFFLNVSINIYFVLKVEKIGHNLHSIINYDEY